MPDIFDLIKNWWKQVLLVVVVSLIVVGIIVYAKPLQYVSVTTAVPASTYSSDKAKIFNDNVQQLYTALGTPDDLDVIVGTGNLDTVYTVVAQNYNLWDHYKMGEKEAAAISKAASILKKNSKVMKSEYGELKVKVWDTDKELAPQLANSIMDQLQSIHQYLQGAGNEATLKGLTSGRERLKAKSDSAAQEKKILLEEKLKQYDNLITEYQLVVDSKPPVLVIVEKAKVSDWPDRPRRIQVLMATAVLAFIFSLFLDLILEKIKTTRK